MCTLQTAFVFENFRYVHASEAYSHSQTAIYMPSAIILQTATAVMEGWERGCDGGLGTRL